MNAAGVCTSCQAPIVWTVDRTTGRRAPIDRDPVAGGNVRLLEPRVPGGPPVSAVVGAGIDLFDDTDDGTRHVSHFATCPHAAEHRRR